MNENSEKPHLQELVGTIERFTFQNEETGYTVARLIPQGKSYEVTVIGSLTGVNIGESVRLKGHWITHPKFGRQFEIHQYTVQLPATIEGLRKYLGSGMVKGIGPVTAANIVDFFGLDTLEIIESNPHRLSEVPGIGYKRTSQIVTAWEEQKQIKEVMLFLQGHGISTGLAVKIYKQYGDEAIEVVRQSPYRLAKDIFGIGFKTADKIARQMGLPLTAPERIQAGLLYAMSAISEDGHCFATREQLLNEAINLLEVPLEDCKVQLDWLLLRQELILDEEAIYLPPFYYAELGTANRIVRLLASPSARLKVFQSANWQEIFAWQDISSEIQLTDQQKDAIQMALSNKVSILTGGPGTGKSTITNNLIQLLQSQQASFLLAAPTGRAAKRMNEATGQPAKTIHRLLEFSPESRGGFKRNEENPLDADLIIVDEVSMVDILLFNRLVSAVAESSHLLLVGDVDQLPSVGPGNVLRDLINSQVIPVTRLETIFRQAQDSHIVENAHRINRGDFPIFAKASQDFFLFSEEDPEKAADWIIDLVTDRISRKFGFAPAEDIQVLSPMHRGVVGVSAINQRLQAALNPTRPGVMEFKHGARTFREGDRVMQIRNDYDRDIFNGDIGKITRIDLDEQVVQVDFDGHLVAYDYSQLDEMVHAYAISIHKAQGSEYPAVVIPLLTQHYLMLQRNLLYTGVTRARKLVVLVGSKRAIGIAVHNDKIAQRNTKLAERLQGKNQPFAGRQPPGDQPRSSG